MAIELPLQSQGFPNLLKKLGVLVPQQGPIWTFTPLVSPVYLLGADAEVNANPPRFSSTQIVVETVNDPINGTLIAQSAALKRGRYVFWLTWFYSNLDVANNIDFQFLTRDENGINQQFVALDRVPIAGLQRSNSRYETYLTMDLLTDGWTAMFVTTTTGTAPTGLILTAQHAFHKYADFSVESESDFL
jgi:hypothetical protein